MILGDRNNLPGFAMWVPLPPRHGWTLRPAQWDKPEPSWPPASPNSPGPDLARGEPQAEGGRVVGAAAEELPGTALVPLVVVHRSRPGEQSLLLPALTPEGVRNASDDGAEGQGPGGLPVHRRPGYVVALAADPPRAA